MAWYPCSRVGCPEVSAKAGKCAAHRKQYERARGTTTERGYGSAHVALRAEWALLVSTGTVLCARCDLPISSTEPWHLDHDDNDRTRYLGPSHARCNTSAGGQLAH